MLKLRKIILLITLLLINVLGTSCGKPTPKEKTLPAGNQALPTEEKKLLENLEKKMTPTAYKLLCKEIRKYKDADDTIEIEKKITFLKESEKPLEKIKDNKPLTKQDKKILENLKTKSGEEFKEEEFKIENFNNTVLFYRDNIDKVKLNLSEALALYENIKKQVEVKNKAKK